jgi:glycosyltransferase 2 family protein
MGLSAKLTLLYLPALKRRGLTENSMNEGPDRILSGSASEGHSPHGSPSSSGQTSFEQTSGQGAGRRWAYGILAGLMTLLLLGWSVRDLSPSGLAQVLAKTHYGWLAIALVSYGLVFLVRAWRWGLLLAAEGSPGGLRDRFNAFTIGYAANSILPASAGEVLRAALLNRFAQVPFRLALGSVLGEKLLDILVVFLMLVGVLARQPALSAKVPLGVIGGLIGCGCGLFWFAARAPQTVAVWLTVPLGWLGLQRLQGQVQSLLLGILRGLGLYRQPLRFLLALLATFVGWAINGITYWAVLLALGIETPGWAGAIATQSLAAFAIIVPSSPGFVGPFEAAVRFGLGLYGVSPTESIAAALLLRLVMYLVLPLLGLGLAARLGLSKQELQRPMVSAEA